MTRCHGVYLEVQYFKGMWSSYPHIPFIFGWRCVTSQSFIPSEMLILLDLGFQSLWTEIEKPGKPRLN